MAADLRACRVLVTPTSYGKHDPRLKTELEAAVGDVIYNPHPRPLTSDEVRALLHDVDGYIAGLDVIDSAALEGPNRLKVIARYGVGVDQVDLAAARARGIRVTNTPGANAGAVAELTIGLMLALARQIPHASQATRAGGWPRLSGAAIEGKTVGLLGLGAVGKEVAKRLSCFGCTLTGYDPLVTEADNVRFAPREEVIAASDFLSLHLPVTPEARGMVNSPFLATMKAGSYLVNTARGELIDDTALLDALTAGHLAGAALDCFTVEPPPVDSPLLALPQVIVTPHSGAHTDGAINAMGWGALRDCLAVLRGEAPANPVV